MLNELSSGFEEYTPTVSRDGRTVVFASDRSGGLGGYDLWMATRPVGATSFDLPTHLDPISSSGDDMGPSLSEDGLTLYFESNGGGPRELYVAQRATTSDRFLSATLVAGPFETFLETGGPEISRDGLTLYFDARGGGGLGGFDIWSVQRASSTSAWDQLTHVTALNTTSNDLDAALDHDELTLYLTSNRVEVPNDLFVTTRPDRAVAFAGPTISPFAGVGIGEYGADISHDGTTMILSVHEPASTLSNLWMSTRACQ